MKSVLITGACGGMGKAAVRLFQKRGYLVFALDRISGTAEENIIPVEADVTSEESLQKAFLSRYLGAKVLTVDEVINNDDLQAEIQILKSHEYLFGKWEFNCEEKCKAFDWGMLSFSAKKNESERVIDLKVQTDCMYPLIAERVERAFIGKKLSSVSQLENCTGVEDEIYNQIIAFIKENI